MENNDEFIVYLRNSLDKYHNYYKTHKGRTPARDIFNTDIYNEISILEEFDKIKEKKSKLGKNQRDFIIIFVTSALMEYRRGLANKIDNAIEAKEVEEVE